MAVCPAHDDHTPSLALKKNEKGDVFVHCYAGCSTEEVLKAVGFESSELYAKNSIIDAKYDYVDENNTLLFQVVRFNPKGFVQRRPNGKGGWGWKVKGAVRPVLYRLPQLLASKRAKAMVFVTEGEKDADNLAALGLTATTNPGGAEKWEPRYSESLRDRCVAILPDNDKAGKDHAEQVASALAGIAYEVKIVDLPGLPKKGDVSDWLAAGGTRDALFALVEKTPATINLINVIPASPGNNVNNVNLTGSTQDAAPITLIKLIKPPVLAEAAYYGLVGEFLRAVAPHSEATDPGVLAHLLPSIGMLIGPGPHIWAGNKQPARISTVLVGETSTGRKGTSNVPVDLLMQQVDADLWQEQRIGGLATGEGLVNKVADKKTHNDDGTDTIEAVEKRLFIVEEEFSKVLAQIRRDGNILSQIIREAFDSGNLAVLTRGNPLQAHGAHICITGHITPDELKVRLNHIEMANGFGNRFLWFYVKSDKVLPRSKPIPESVFATFVPRLQALVRVQGKPYSLCGRRHGPLGKGCLPQLTRRSPWFGGGHDCPRFQYRPAHGSDLSQLA